MAPLPKPDGTRVRRNLGQKQWRTVERGAVPVPAMPGSSRLPADVKRAAQAYWKAIWTDLGAIYTDADRHPLSRMCVLHARVQLGQRVGAQLQAELRQLEQAYGGSPLGRQRLMVQVAVPEPDSGESSAPVVDMAAQRERRKRIAAQR